MRSLVIIDMQPMFRASLEPGLIKPITREINLAKKHKHPIIVVEYESQNKERYTLDFISDNVKGYAKYVQKKTEDGARVISSTISTLTRSKKVRVLGVNTGACVAKTVRSLVKAGYDVQVVADGCWDSLVPVHRKYIQKFMKEKIKVLRAKGELNVRLYHWI